MLVNGVWQGDWAPVDKKDEKGGFVRQVSEFRNWITADGSAGKTGFGGFKAEPGRYHLYVAYICPWASRTLMVREIKQLQNLISVSVVNPQMTDEGWRFGQFPGADVDPLFNKTYLHEIYTQADSNYTGRATVPVLWDKKQNTMVNNESADIIRMLNSAFNNLGADGPDLYPQHLAEAIDDLNSYLYPTLNNGVYRAGFATTQEAYDEAYQQVFEALDFVEERLANNGGKYLFGDELTEADIRLFVTLVRFDAAYHGLFKCNRNTLRSMPNVYGYMKRIHALKGIASTVNLAHIKAGYYAIKSLNPNGIVPRGPEGL